MNSMIQTIDLTKKFNDFVANDHINLDVKDLGHRRQHSSIG